MLTLRRPMIGSPSLLQSRVLIVDDDVDMRDALALFFAGQGHECELAADAAAALRLVELSSIDAVVCDVRMEGMNGFELHDRVKRTHPALPFVFITAMGGVRDAVDAIKRGAFQYFTKPCDLAALGSTVLAAIEERRRRADADGEARSRPPASAPSDNLIGDGPAMRTLHASISFVAASAAPVVVTGGTGSGKELVARAIHARGPRRGRPFVAVNTSAIPEPLLEGEIFGHVRGAFTGAIHARRGLLTEADGGTLLLDEIGDMPIGLQAKLLRVLQFGEVRPVGGDRSHRVDVRVIASTHRDLPTLVREGRFREDLYFRLNVLPVFVPALRDRREDIPALAEHFLAAACRRAPHSPVRSIGAEAIRALTEAPWPGNVRELESIIERAVVFGTEETLTRRSLVGEPDGEKAVATVPWSFPNQVPWTLRRLSRVYAEWVLAEADGNKERAASILGIDLSTLYRWRRSAQD
jgi:two-component system response regulator HydG